MKRRGRMEILSPRKPEQMRRMTCLYRKPSDAVKLGRVGSMHLGPDRERCLMEQGILDEISLFSYR